MSLPAKTIDKFIIPLLSFLWSTSSLMVFSVLTIFLSEDLKLSYVYIGMLEGGAIFIAFIAKTFAGIISDYLKQRRLFILLGAWLTLLTKLMFASTYSLGMLFAARFLDRMSKGIRSAPADAFIADMFSQTKQVQMVFTLRQSFYALGGFCGTGIAMLLLHLQFSSRDIFFMATFPALLAFIAAWYLLPRNKQEVLRYKQQWQLNNIMGLSFDYWKIIGINFLLMLAKFSENFMIIKAKAVGWPIALLPLIIMLAHSSHSLVAFVNKYFVKHDNNLTLLFPGIAALMLADLCFGYGRSYAVLLIGVIFSGIHLGLTQGVLRGLIAETCAPAVYGSAFSIFYLTTGLAICVGNYCAGRLAEYNVNLPFLFGFVCSAISVILLKYWDWRRYTITPNH